MKDFRANRNIVYECRYHVVFCPKCRRRALISGVPARLKEIAAEVVQRLGQDEVQSLWANFYFAATAGEVTLDTIKRNFER